MEEIIGNLGDWYLFTPSCGLWYIILAQSGDSDLDIARLGLCVEWQIGVN